MSTFCFHFPAPCDAPIDASTAFTSATTPSPNSFAANSIPGSISAAFSSAVIPGFASTLPRIQLSRSVTVSARNSSVATSYPHSRNAPSVNFWMFPLCTSVTVLRPSFNANAIAARTSRFDPVIEIGLIPTPESSRTRFFVPFSISSLTNAINFAASGVPSRNSIPA